MRPLNVLAAVAVATIVSAASLTGARAMPIGLPSAGMNVHETASGEMLAARSSLIQDVRWRRGWHRRGWHRRHWRRWR